MTAASCAAGISRAAHHLRQRRPPPAPHRALRSGPVPRPPLQPSQPYRTCPPARSRFDREPTRAPQRAPPGCLPTLLACQGHTATADRRRRDPAPRRTSRRRQAGKPSRQPIPRAAPVTNATRPFDRGRWCIALLVSHPVATVIRHCDTHSTMSQSPRPAALRLRRRCSGRIADHPVGRDCRHATEAHQRHEFHQWGTLPAAARCRRTRPAPGAASATFRCGRRGHRRANERPGACIASFRRSLAMAWRTARALPPCAETNNTRAKVTLAERPSSTSSVSNADSPIDRVPEGCVLG